MPIKADKATFFTPSSYTFSVKQVGPKTLSERTKTSTIQMTAETYNIRNTNSTTKLQYIKAQTTSIYKGTKFSDSLPKLKGVC